MLAQSSLPLKEGRKKAAAAACGQMSRHLLISDAKSVLAVARRERRVAVARVMVRSQWPCLSPTLWKKERERRERSGATGKLLLFYGLVVVRRGLGPDGD